MNKLAKFGVAVEFGTSKLVKRRYSLGGSEKLAFVTNGKS